MESGSQSCRCHSASHGRLVGGSCTATRGYLSSAGLIMVHARIISAQCSCDGTAITGRTDVDACETTLRWFYRYIWLLTKTNRVPAQTSLSEQGHHGHRVCLGIPAARSTSRRLVEEASDGSDDNADLVTLAKPLTARSSDVQTRGAAVAKGHLKSLRGINTVYLPGSALRGGSTQGMNSGYAINLPY